MSQETCRHSPLMKRTQMKTIRFVMLACFFAYGCGRVQQKDQRTDGHGEGGFPVIGTTGFSVDISPTRLPVAENRHSSAIASLFENWDGTLSTREGTARTDLRPKAGVLLHRYPHMTVGGHFRATGTFVCFVPDKGVFFLFGDCGMNHIEDSIRPYAGDPRKVLLDVMKGSEQGAPADADKPHR